ncbi:MAG: membrane protein insertion efficiency factor YidD [Ruminococcaceae bacterium]|nr:membrane protein insertion efficiency factor YidD [Oscillospiraceae bacterium]
MKTIIKAFIRFYQICLSPLFHGCCRFYPTCSAYALEAVEVHGALKGSWLAFKRILRCNPLFPGGYDPVPPIDYQRNLKNRRK